MRVALNEDGVAGGGGGGRLRKRRAATVCDEARLCMRRGARELSSRHEQLRHHPGNCGVHPRSLVNQRRVPSPSLHARQIAPTSKPIFADFSL